MAPVSDLEAQRASYSEKSSSDGTAHGSFHDELSDDEKAFHARRLRDSLELDSATSLHSLPTPVTAAAASEAALTDAAEYHTPTTSKWLYLAAYFTCNVALTLYNKSILGRFACPWLLTAIHAGAASIGCYGLRLRGSVPRTSLTRQQETVLLAFSVLFTVNIAISNVSLAMVSIPFHQIMRSTCPVFTVLIYRLRYGRVYSSRTYLSLIPVVLGVALATYGDYYFTAAGFFFTFLGVILASVKTVATNRIMTGPLALTPLESLMRMSPLACAQALLCAFFSGEMRAITDNYSSISIQPRLFWALVGNGALAFALNIASFSTNRKTGALTMTVCGNVKQSLTVLLGITLFGVQVGLANGIGMLVALVGAAWYSMVELRIKAAGAR